MKEKCAKIKGIKKVRKNVTKTEIRKTSKKGNKNSTEEYKHISQKWYKRAVKERRWEKRQKREK